MSSGTSLAAPVVAATAALVIGYATEVYGRRLNPSEVRYIIRETSIDLGPKGWDPYYSYGMVNVSAAVELVNELLGKKHWHIKLDPPGNLDLHVVDSLGRHVGINYTTGELEIEIPGAIHTGDEDGGFETIFLPFDITDFDISIVGTEVNGSSPYTLQVIASDEFGNVLGEWNFEGTITQDETQQFTSTTTETGELLIISWEYVFEDAERGTMLKISNEDHYFQFIAPDKTFSVKYDHDMFVYRHVIVIRYEDEGLKLVTIAIDTNLDLCVAYAKDIQLDQSYLLIDGPGTE